MLKLQFRVQRKSLNLQTFSQDKEKPARVAEQFQTMIDRASELPNVLPELRRYLLKYPKAELTGADSFFYWEKVAFAMKPTIRVNHSVIYRGRTQGRDFAVVAIKQLYATHYFHTALDMSVCGDDGSAAAPRGFYLLTLKGSQQEGLTGVDAPEDRRRQDALVARERARLHQTHHRTIRAAPLIRFRLASRLAPAGPLARSHPRGVRLRRFPARSSTCPWAPLLHRGDPEMENVLAGVFDSEAQARAASVALERLAEADTIGLNAGAIVTKSAGGAITVSGAHRPAPEGALGATAVGTIIVMLGGPVGLAIGAATGLALGATADVFDLKVERDFLADVERALEPGKSAVVAQIYEETGPVNERMAALGAVVVFRRAHTAAADQEYEKGVAAIKRRVTAGHHV